MDGIYQSEKRSSLVHVYSRRAYLCALPKIQWQKESICHLHCQVNHATLEAIQNATAAAAPDVPLVLDDATARAIFGPLRVSRRDDHIKLLSEVYCQHFIVA